MCIHSHHLNTRLFLRPTTVDMSAHIVCHSNMTDTATFLATLGTFILCTPLNTLTDTFRSNPFEPSDLLCQISTTFQPRDSTSRLCQRIVRWLQQPTAVEGRDPVVASPSTIPLALCLLVRFRLACAKPQTTNDELLATAVFVAYKFLVDGGEERRSRWAVALEMGEGRMGVVERGFLETLGHGVWVRDGEFLMCVGRMEWLWEEGLEELAMAARPMPPRFAGR